MENLERQWGNFLKRESNFSGSCKGHIHNSNAKMNLKIILIQIQSQNKLFECFTLFDAISKSTYIYTQDLSLHYVPINLLTI